MNDWVLGAAVGGAVLGAIVGYDYSALSALTLDAEMARVGLSALYLGPLIGAIFGGLFAWGITGGRRK